MFWADSSWPNLMKLHKQIIQDLIDPLTKNHVDRTIKTRVILNLGVHTFTDRQVQTRNHSNSNKKQNFESMSCVYVCCYFSGFNRFSEECLDQEFGGWGCMVLNWLIFHWFYKHYGANAWSPWILWTRNCWFLIGFITILEQLEEAMGNSKQIRKPM